LCHFFHRKQLIFCEMCEKRKNEVTVKIRNNGFGKVVFCHLI